MDHCAVRLSCEQCRRRKTKCDKEAPCSACQNAGFSCNTVQRARLPRGRSALHRSMALDTRVARLEELVRKLKTQSQSGGDHNSLTSLEAEDTSELVVQPSDKINDFVARDFWAALSQEVTGIRDILEESDEESIPQEAAIISEHVRIEPDCSFGTILFGQGFNSGNDTLLQRPTRSMRTILFQLYQHRVDSVFKVGHWPTIVAAIEIHHTDARDGTRSPRMQALEFAIYFTALTSITDEESENLLFNKRQVLLQQYRLATEISMSRANLPRNPDLILLQAFVIYLVGLRTSMSCATTWTLLAVAVRLASALGLDSDDTSNTNSYELEIRRRLWFAIGVFDTHLALDRGSIPLLPQTAFEFPPLNISNSDLTLTGVAKLSSQRFTDMSFCSMTYELVACQRKLQQIPTGPEDCWDSWNEKVQMVTDLHEFMVKQYSRFEDSTRPLEKFTWAVADGAVTNIRIMLRRPLYRNKHHSVPPWDEFDVMKATTEALERALEKYTIYEFAPWAWFAWVKWYALAVLLAELCGPCKGPSVDRAYVVAQDTFVQYARLIADTDSGMLWKPIVKLMRRVIKIRGSVVREMPTVPPQSLPAVKTVGGDSITEELYQAAFRDPGDNFTLGMNDQELSNLLNYTDENWKMSSNSNGSYGGDPNFQQTMDNEGCEDGMPGLNWDFFLQDVITNSAGTE